MDVMEAKKLSWYKIAASENDLIFNTNSLLEIEIADRQVCLSKWSNKLFATNSKCPHAGGNLAKGYLDALGNIVCPLHHYKFSLETGRNTSGEGYFLKRYPIEINNEGIFICLEEN